MGSLSAAGRTRGCRSGHERTGSHWYRGQVEERAERVALSILHVRTAGVRPVRHVCARARARGDAGVAAGPPRPRNSIGTLLTGLRDGE